MVPKKGIFPLAYFTGKIVTPVLSCAPPRVLDFPELWEAEQSVQQEKRYKKCRFYLPIKPLNKCL